MDQLLSSLAGQEIVAVLDSWEPISIPKGAG
jgi:hypothetical protein